MQKLLFFILITLPVVSHSQTFNEWFKQKKTQKKYLLEQVAKLQIYLDQLKEGYSVAKDGLTAIGRFKNGEFTLHSDYHTHLRNVSPQVKSWSKALAVVAMQKESFALYKDYRSWFTNCGLLTASEQGYCFQLLANMLDAIALQVNDLLQVLTNGQLQMTDHQRLEQIDRIYGLSLHIKTSLQSFIKDMTGLVSVRKQNRQDIDLLQHLSLPQ
ncbi:putative membrane protein [Filimonas zeae]|uniref:TerB family tellurite resistance protein n=1 Tax=Filimonas zeae TaxID=1737353 RepID=A0A917IRS6_9BACT|nr:hypothetical protein [Filimonas zeae]MDR6337683.1 putative membrane protein [Filimonas zeae]GGH59769.1 hypothetical protein GCM10011379_06910 [Filimonas zeae]